jgi:hypothetical protein
MKGLFTGCGIYIIIVYIIYLCKMLEQMKRTILSAMIFFTLLSCSTTKNVDSSISESLPLDRETEEMVVEPVMVYYEGDLLNIFFHPLVARPEIAFKGSMKRHFLEWFVTAGEYKKILYELYIQNYVLVDINEFYTVTYTDKTKTVKAKKILVPQGKKPIILSIDDLSYYEHCRKNGVVHKLVLDEKGGIAAWTAGELSYDIDIITITEDFIQKHPDFSIRGAKGIIALTGYEGILGHQTQAENSNARGYQKEIENAVLAVNKLKELGWRFASHSWGHLNMQNVPLSWLIYDNKLWDKEVKPILGETDLYIYPFGAVLENHEEKHKILRDRGINLFFGVGSGYGYKAGPESEYIFLTRRNIDGFYFRVFRNRDDKLFDIDVVMDKQNRGIR